MLLLVVVLIKSSGFYYRTNENAEETKDIIASLTNSTFCYHFRTTHRSWLTGLTAACRTGDDDVVDALFDPVSGTVSIMPGPNFAFDLFQDPCARCLQYQTAR